MAQLTIKVPGAPAREIHLKPGRHLLGRSPGTDCPIADASVSGAHCELTVGEAGVGIKDLGSTNGTFIDGEAVQEGMARPGQMVRMGQVELHFQGEGDGNPATPAEVNGDRAVAAWPVPPAIPPAPMRVPRLTVPVKRRRQQGFFRSIPGAFGYPLRGNALGVLLAGTVCYGTWDFVFGAGSALGLLRLFMTFGMGTMLTGYFYRFLQTVVTHTALGDDEVPGWPEFENFWESGIRPFLQAVAAFALGLAPLMFYFFSVEHAGGWPLVAFFCLGMLMLPMALLAVSMFDSFLALNPMLIVPSMVKVPAEYLVCCVIMGTLCVGIWWLDYELKRALEVRLVADILAEFLLLYSLMVEMRMLGLLYYTEKERLAWPI